MTVGFNQVTKFNFLWGKVDTGKLSSDWVKIGENFFWGQNFHKVVDLTVLSTFMQVLPRSEWKTHFHLSNRVDSGTKLHLLMSRMWFWNIWSDWVKIGENYFWGQNFQKVVHLTVLSTFMQVLPRSEWKSHFHLSDRVDSGRSEERRVGKECSSRWSPDQ